MKIVFVCTGNTCRSPMAKYIAEDYLQKAGIKAEVTSAGLAVNPFEKATANAIEVMRELGIDLSNHVASQFTKTEALEADYIIPMTSSHKMALINKGVKPDKILEFDSQVYDPYDQDIDVYRKCRDQLRELIKKLVDKIYESKKT